MLIAAQVHSLQHHSVSAIPDLHWICAANISATMLAASRGGVGTRVDAHLVQVQVGNMDGSGQVLTCQVLLFHDSQN
jgi:hypothetical protein